MLFRCIALWALLSLSATPARPQDLLPPVRVAAAASLKEALDEVGREFQRLQRGRIVATYAATPALARQIEAGAPFDVFIAADEEWMDYLEARSAVIRETRMDLLGNALVLVAPRSADGRWHESDSLKIARGFPLAAALGNRRLAIANPDRVPAGKYARAALTALQVWPLVEDKLARAENVRAALMFVARGEAPLGIVYRTDAIAEPAVRVVDTFDPSLHPPIVYPAALVRGHRPAAAAFLAFVADTHAWAIWRQHGFTVPR